MAEFEGEAKMFCSSIQKSSNNITLELKTKASKPVNGERTITIPMTTITITR